MKLKLPKEITVLTDRFDIHYDKTHNGASFSFRDSKMVVGIKAMPHNPIKTLGVISHELMEIILCSMGGRFYNDRISENYLFVFNHQTLENAIEIHTELLSKFIHHG